MGIAFQAHAQSLQELAMNGKFGLVFLAFSLFFSVTALPAERGLRIRGKSLTPRGDQVSLDWQVEKRDNTYLFYLNHRLKAEMVVSDCRVAKIRRRVRFDGKERWFSVTSPLQIRLELNSGFYPFSAVLNYRENKARKTLLPTGRFTVEGSPVK